MKNSYQKGNWKQYTQNLINRGSITFWFPNDSVKKWKAKKDKKHFGRPFVYSDMAIETAHTIRHVYHLPLRALQGFISSLFCLLNLSLKTPCYTQICKRAKKLSLPPLSFRKHVTDIVFDASGLKVYGEGEWKVRSYGFSKRRKWMKIHLGIDPKTQEILLSKLTDNHSDDIDVAIDLLDDASFPIDKVYGDGLYDAEKIYEKLWNRDSVPIIPTRKNARNKNTKKPWLFYREKQISEIKGLGGDDLARSIWKKLTGYHQRSLVETAFSRWKQLLGPKLKSRKSENQTFEAKIKCHILNKMRLGF
jgi:hypothetical protein